MRAADQPGTFPDMGRSMDRGTDPRADPRLSALLSEYHGVLRWDQMTATIGVGAARWAVHSGRLVRVLPQTYALPAVVHQVDTLRRVALAYAGPGSALFGPTGLAVWGVSLRSEPAKTEGASGAVRASGRSLVHVAVPVTCRRRSAPGVRVHRMLPATPGCARPAGARRAVVRNDLAVMDLDSCLVDAWPLLPPLDRRAAVITAVRERRTTEQRLLAAIADRPRLADRAALRRLVALVCGGSHSELEIWGLERVFSHPSLPPAARQHPVLLGRRTRYLDVAYPEVMLAAELDSYAWHSDASARERDIRDDAALARLGWLTVRFDAQALFGSPASVRHQVLDIYQARRRQLGQRSARRAWPGGSGRVRAGPTRSMSTQGC